MCPDSPNTFLLIPSSSTSPALSDMAVYLLLLSKQNQTPNLSSSSPAWPSAVLVVASGLLAEAH